MPGLIVDIVDLPRATGSVKNLQIRTPAPADLGTEVIGVPEGSDLALDVTLTSMDDGVLAQADADLHVHGECVRCLRDLDEDRTVRIDELYLFPGDEEAEDLLAVGETTLDLEPALRDALVPTLPFQPLCRPDCPGLCADCGKRLEDLPADHHHEVLDPRWSALAGLLDAGNGQESDPDAPTSGQERA